MKHKLTHLMITATLVLTATFQANAAQRTVGKSPWGPADEIGRLNLITEASRSAILSRISGGAVYDLSVDYFIGMPRRLSENREPTAE